MTTRQIITWGLLLLVVGGNLALWFFYNREPPAPFASRDEVRSQMSDAWSDADSVPLLDAVAAMRQLAEAVEQREPVEDNPYVSFATMAPASRRDLVDAVCDLVVAVSDAEPNRLLSYMRSRDMKLEEKRLDELMDQPGQPEAARGRGQAESRLRELWHNPSTGAHWAGLVIEATNMRVWKPPSKHHISIVQLGETASWVWNNETLYESVFVSQPLFKQAIERGRVPVADVRLLIEHDEAMGGERGFYFIRLWKPSDEAKWQPLAIKLVRTAPEAYETPRLVW